MIKYSSWSFEDLEEMDNEDDAEGSWNNSLETADSNLFRYCREDVQLRKLLVESGNRGDYEIMEEPDCEHELGEPEQ